MHVVPYVINETGTYLGIKGMLMSELGAIFSAFSPQLGLISGEAQRKVAPESTPWRIERGALCLAPSTADLSPKQSTRDQSLF